MSSAASSSGPDRAAAYDVLRLVQYGAMPIEKELVLIEKVAQEILPQLESLEQKKQEKRLEMTTTCFEVEQQYLKDHYMRLASGSPIFMILDSRIKHKVWEATLRVVEDMTCSFACDVSMIIPVAQRDSSSVEAVVGDPSIRQGKAVSLKAGQPVYITGALQVIGRLCYIQIGFDYLKS